MSVKAPPAPTLSSTGRPEGSPEVLGQVLTELMETGATGVLTVTVTRKIRLVNGVCAGYESDAPGDELGPRLVRSGWLSEGALEGFKDKAGEGGLTSEALAQQLQTA